MSDFEPTRLFRETPMIQLLKGVEGVEPETIQHIARLNTILGNQTLAELFFGVRNVLKIHKDKFLLRDIAESTIKSRLKMYDEFHANLIKQNRTIDQVTEDMIIPGQLRLDYLQMGRSQVEEAFKELYKDYLDENADKIFGKHLAQDFLHIQESGKLTDEEYDYVLDLMGIDSINQEGVQFKEDITKDNDSVLYFSIKMYQIGARVSDSWRKLVSMNPMIDEKLYGELKGLGVEENVELNDIDKKAFFENIDTETVLSVINSGELTDEFFEVALETFLERLESLLPSRETVALARKQIKNRSLMERKNHIELRELLKNLFGQVENGG